MFSTFIVNEANWEGVVIPCLARWTLDLAIQVLTGVAPCYTFCFCHYGSFCSEMLDKLKRCLRIMSRLFYSSLRHWHPRRPRCSKPEGRDFSGKSLQQVRETPWALTLTEPVTLYLRPKNLVSRLAAPESLRMVHLRIEDNGGSRLFQLP